MLCGAQYGRRDRLFTRLPVHLSTCSRVDSFTCPLVYSFTDLLVYLFLRRLVYGPRVYSSTGSLVYLFPRRLVDGSTGLLVYRFTCLLISPVDRFAGLRVYSSTGSLVYSFPPSTRLRVRGFTRLPVHLSTRFPRRRHHNCPRTAGRIWASSSTTRARSKPSRITARMVSSPAIVPHRLSGSCASISVVMLVA